MASLQYPSLPTSTNDLSILLKQESLDDLLGFSPLPSLSEEDAFGSAPLLGIYADSVNVDGGGLLRDIR
ncbi:hypothetical protein NUW54_g6540 [Trametes sanguinea]|uniref:Uncharacterized protein n=1 Tax=Trametes sanguinea TaxID=158606 RepID=A0ACC1PTT2_9APHY|nr:hypothetical protein NUW54_g6540 [Trametes sanguinea]